MEIMELHRMAKGNYFLLFSLPLFPNKIFIEYFCLEIVADKKENKYSPMATLHYIMLKKL